MRFSMWLAAVLLLFLPGLARAGCVGSGSGCAAFVPAVVAAKALGEPDAGNCSGAASPAVRISDGDEVALATGNRFLSADDYVGTGPFPLRLARFYNSQDSTRNWLGVGWHISYMRALTPVVAGVMHAVRDDGRVLTLVWRAGRWVADADVSLSVLQIGAPGGRFVWLLRGCDGSSETYSEAGRLLSIVNRAGLRQSLSYDVQGRITQVSDPAGRVLAFSYGGSASAPSLSVTAPDGGVTSYLFDDQHRMVSVTHADGSKLGFAYTDANFPQAMTAVTDELGNAFSAVSYDGSGRVQSAALAGGAGAVTIDASQLAAGSVTITNALGSTEEFAFDMLAGSAVRTGLWRDCLGTCAGYYTSAPFLTSYDANANPVSTTDFIGNVTSFSFDAASNLELSRTEAVGQSYVRTITTSWNSQFRLPLVVTRPGRMVSNVYDASGNLLSRTVSAGSGSRVWRYSYNQSGQVLTGTDPAGNVTRYGYDGSGDLVSVTNPLGQSWTYGGFDGGGRPTSVSDPNSVAGGYGYDQRGHLISRQFGGATQGFQYDATGMLVRYTRADGGYLTFSHDAAHRLSGIADALGDAIAFTLDAAGNRSAVRISDGSGVVRYQHAYQYDAFGRLVSDTGAGGQVTNYAYNYNDSPALMTNPLGQARLTSIDQLGRVIALVEPTGAATRLFYDALDHLVARSDARGNATDYVVDGFDELLQVNSPDSGIASFAYDLAGNEVGRVDGRGAAASVSFDALGRPLVTSYAAAAGENVSRVYDNCANGVGRLCAMSDPAGTLSLAYDPRGNIVAQSRNFGGVTLSCGFSYGLADDVSAISYPSGLVVRITRDAMGRVVGISATPPGGSAVAVLSNVQYQPFGRPVGWLWFNGVTRARPVDLDGRISGISDVVGGVTRLGLGYTRDAAGRVSAISDAVTAANNQSFSHDAAGRLVGASGGYGTVAYGYDAAGNRISDPSGAYSIGAANNLAASITDGSGAVVMRFAYDAAGALLSMTPASGAAVGFSYGQSGRLAAVVSGGTTLAQFSYDGFGRRAVKSGPSGIIAMFVDDPHGHLLEETDGAGVARYDIIWLDGEPVARFDPASGAFHALHTDARGAVVLLTDAAGAVAWQGGYQPFGSLASLSGVLTQNLRLAGQYADSETGLHQNGVRDALPGEGRYLEPLPPREIFANPEENPYSFADDMPFDRIEPDGLGVAPAVP